MRSSGSRVDIAQKPNNSGQILDQRWKIFLVIFTKLIPRRIFLYCKHFGVDGVSPKLASLSGSTMLGVILSDHIPGDLNLTLTLTANSNLEFSGIKPDTDRIFKSSTLTSTTCQRQRVARESGPDTDT